MSTKNIQLDGSSVPLRKFELDWMVDNPSICMVAKRGSGKSYICRDILRHLKNVPGGVIISPTDRMSSFYGEFVPESFIHYEYSTELIEKILYRQEMIIEKSKEKAKEGKKIDTRLFVVMDDCLADSKSWANDKPIMELFFNGRHYHITYILTMQYPLGISPRLRSNFDYIFLLADDITSNVKKIHEHYAGMFPSLKAFKDVYGDVTNDYGCMVIANRGARANFLDKVFWYRAKDIDIGHIGSRQYNDFNEMNYNEEWRSKKKSFDARDFFDNKSRRSFKVNKVIDEVVDK